MNIINIAFNEISAKKQNPAKGNVNVSNNVKVVSVKESKLNLDTTRKTFEIEFEYLTTYNPDVGSIQLKGRLLGIHQAEQVDELLSQWEKEKKLTNKQAPLYINPIMNKAVLETIILARELELPSPIPLPNVKTN